MTFDYNIVRSVRKNVTVSVSADNIITVRCPLSMSDCVVEQFIDSKSDWLFKVIAQNNLKRADNESILNYKEILVGGQRLPLIFSDKNTIENGAFYVKNKQSVKKTLIRLFSDDLINFAIKTAKQVRLHADFSVKSYKSRWGCCDRKGAVTLNCALVMLPFYLQRYVIIHELCHTVHFNHSAAFWKLVAKHEPNYKLCRKNLNDFNFLTKIYDIF